jgi:hypothetical protein
LVLCSNYLSIKQEILDIPTDSGMYATNHLLFVDDLKIMAEIDEELKMLI